MKLSLKTKLRIRVILLALVSLFLILSAIVGISVWHNYRDLTQKSDMLISQLHNNPSSASRYFSVKIPAGTTAVYPDVVQHVTVTQDQAADLAQKALDSGKDAGFLAGYRFRIYRNDSGTRIYFLARDAALDMYYAATENMLWVSLAGLCLIGLLLIPMSGWLVAPLVENQQKQKSFITSAGHALKTPLTVISTNAQLLELEIGENRWISSIREQLAHMTQLTQTLVTLSKAEEAADSFRQEEFCFGELLRGAVQTYNAVAQQKNITLEQSIPETLPYVGSRPQVQQLLWALLDNACKYCSPGEKVRLEAKPLFRGVQLTVENPSRLPKTTDVRGLSQRFCRGENAAEEKGFGIGLSMVETIAEQHGGTLQLAITEEGVFRVTVTLN